MKIIIWENLYSWDKSKKGRFLLALLRFLKKNKHDVKNINKKGFSQADLTGCDFVIMWGSSNRWSRKVYEEHRKAGIPVLVVENGYFSDDYCSYGWNRHYYLPKKTDKSRLELFDIDIKARRSNKGNKIILADRGHLRGWFKNILNRMPEDKEVVFRPHPLRPQENMEGVKRETGEVCWDEVFAVVTDMSAFGNEALKHGVPVFCRKEASYSVLGNVINKDTDFSKPVKPKKADIENYFARLAWSQYSTEELDLMLDLYIKEIKNA